MIFRTRLGPVLETEIGNATPIIEIFRDSEYDVPIDWPSVRRVVDVGGHIGAFAAWVSIRAPRAQIVSFEPDPRNFRELEKNIVRNGISQRVTIINAAVGASEGRRLLHTSSQPYVSSFTASSGTRAVEVKSVVLAAYLRQRADEPVDVLKLDCEGAEWEILGSLSSESLSRIQHVLVECHMQQAHEVAGMMQLLAARGFCPKLRSAGAATGPYPNIALVWAQAK